MKKLLSFTLGIWCVITCFCSPVWLTLAVVNLTGLIYKYDYSMDEGTAGIIGIILLILWIVFVLLPNVVFIKKYRNHLAMFAVHRNVRLESDGFSVFTEREVNNERFNKGLSGEGHFDVCHSADVWKYISAVLQYGG